MTSMQMQLAFSSKGDFICSERNRIFYLNGIDKAPISIYNKKRQLRNQCFLFGGEENAAEI